VGADARWYVDSVHARVDRDGSDHCSADDVLLSASLLRSSNLVHVIFYPFWMDDQPPDERQYERDS
jgi:hypothetical protein